MPNPEETLLRILDRAGVDFTASLPCEKIKVLLEHVEKNFMHVALTREEEGVGICAGAALAGKNPAIFVQSSGIGNMVNALLSLTQFYELPLAIFVSRRGVYQEKIAAQFPMGLKLPGILKGAGIPFTELDSPAQLGTIQKRLNEVYQKGRVHAFLMSPALWAGSSAVGCAPVVGRTCRFIDEASDSATVKPSLSRYEVLQEIVPYLENRAVVCNLGFPSKELYSLRDHASHFYMLGSMGMATPLGLGISLAADRSVTVIDGDGSLLMNPGTLATAAASQPRDLTIVCIDNAAYGSTGNQPTFSGSCVDLSAVARGFGIANVRRVSTRSGIRSAMKKAGGLRFLHVLGIPGNRDVANIPISHLDMKIRTQEFLRGDHS